MTSFGQYKGIICRPANIRANERCAQDEMDNPNYRKALTERLRQNDRWIEVPQMERFQLSKMQLPADVAPHLLLSWFVNFAVFCEVFAPIRGTIDARQEFSVICAVNRRLSVPNPLGSNSRSESQKVPASSCIGTKHLNRDRRSKLSGV